MKTAYRIVFALLFLAAVVVQITGGFAFSPMGIRISVARPNPIFAFMVALSAILAILSHNFRESLTGSITAISNKGTREYLFGGIFVIIGLLMTASALIKPMTIFDLGREDALGTYFSGAILFLTGAFAFSAGFDRQKGKLRWFIVTGIFWAMALDELTSIHESVPRRLETLGIGSGDFAGFVPWIALLAPVIIAVSAFLIWFGWKLGPKSRPLALAGLAAWIASLSLEQMIMGYHIPMAECIAEEGCEMVGTTMFALAFALKIRQAKPDI